MENEKRAARQRQEDAVLNRVLIWFGAAVVVELLMLLLNRYFINYTTNSSEITLAATLSKILPIAAIAALVLCVVCGIWFWNARKSGKKAGLPMVLTLVFAALFVCFGVTYQFRAVGVQLLCGAVPVVAVMALVYYLYQKEFFAVTVLSAIGILGLWIIRKANGGHAPVVYGFVAVAAVVMLLAALGVRNLQKNGGMLVRGEKKIHVFSRNANYGMLYLTCGIVAAVLIAACLLGTTVAYYLIFGLVAWLFVMAVYYTVKLM
ncbi:MAG: hypothetical protein EOM52_01215 [Clostridia bacterium]|nr:hypothetical protein [Clostridia bacterium]